MGRSQGCKYYGGESILVNRILVYFTRYDEHFSKEGLEVCADHWSLIITTVQRNNYLTNFQCIAHYSLHCKSKQIPNGDLSD